MIEELSPIETKKILTMRKSPSKDNMTEPEHRLFNDYDKNNKKMLVAEFYMPDVIDIKEISVEANDDRLIIECKKYGYMFDAFLPHKVDEKKTLAEYDNERMVRISFQILNTKFIYNCNISRSSKSRCVCKTNRQNS